MKKTHLSLTSLAVFIMTQGCGTWLYYHVSEPLPVPGVSTVLAEASLGLRLPDGNIALGARNRLHYASQRNVLFIPLPEITYRQPPPLHESLEIWIAISPKSGGELLFDPFRIRIVRKGDKSEKPEMVLGPSVRREWFDLRWNRTCRFDKDKDRFLPTNHPAVIEKESCFSLTFNADRDPKKSFSLSIEGLSKSGEPISVPPIEFQLGQLTGHRPYW